MRTLSPQATATFRKLIEGLERVGDSRKIHNNTSYMAVCVEIIGEDQHGKRVSVTHYYEQMGDLMSDPDMTFLVAPQGDVIPLTFQQDNMGIYHEAAWLDGDEWKEHPRMQADITAFADEWMSNIEAQQFQGE